jgi:hypothetical protein
VDAAAEGELPVDVGSPDVERVRVVEDGVVALRGGVMDVQVRACRDVDPGEPDPDGWSPGARRIPTWTAAGPPRPRAA